MGLFTLFFFSLILMSCSWIPELDDGYQHGDVIKMTARHYHRFKELRDQYCHNAGDNLARQIALSTLRVQYPMIPRDGICTNLSILLENEAIT